VGSSMRRVNRELRGATGIRNPLEPPLFGSDERKIERVRGRAWPVDWYLMKFAGDVIATEGMLPNVDELPADKNPVWNFINRHADYIRDRLFGL
jgi:hypothetical protein